MYQKLMYKGVNGAKAMKTWIVPYVYSRILKDEFRPLLSYLYTDWKCNINCHYCFQYDNAREGMSLETAKESIDWLQSVGCRMLALMGGEPLVRKDFILDVTRYAKERGFYVYLPTNGYLMDKEFIDEMGEAGMDAINLAVDTVKPRKGLPKGLLGIEPQFRYLVEQKLKYKYLIFFNINICRTNLKDVKMLTEIARQNNIDTDYHLTEAPQQDMDISHYKYADNDLAITPDEYEELDELVDWLIDKQKKGWAMVNSIEHLENFKHRKKGGLPPWDCRAGINGSLIKPDGSLAPCFDLMENGQDWGRIGQPKFDRERLAQCKEKCLPACSSTCFHTMASYYDLKNIPEWIRKNTRMG